MEKEQISEFEIECGMIMKYHGDKTDVVIPEGVEDIFWGAFPDNLSSITIAGTIPEITPMSFASHHKLKKVVIKDGVRDIGFSAFQYCELLEEVYVPKSIVLIDNKAFLGCSSLKKIYYAGTEQDWENVKKNDDWNCDAGEFEVVFDFAGEV